MYAFPTSLKKIIFFSSMDAIDLNGLEERMILEVCESMPAKYVEEYIEANSA